MIGTWRISTYNAALTALYFIPAWTLASYKIAIVPIHGLYDRPNIAFGIFFSDYLQLSSAGTIRAAWLLVVLRMTTVAFLVVFVLQVARPSSRLKGEGNEAFLVALVIGSIMSLLAMCIAAEAGEAAALHLHATETLLLAASAILALAEPWLQPRGSDSLTPARFAPAPAMTGAAPIPEARQMLP